VSSAGDGAKYVQWSTIEDGKLSEREIWLINKKGIYQVAVGKKLTRLSSPQLMLGFPIKPGAKAAWKGTVVDDSGETRNMTVTWVVNGEEQSDSANKTYNALKISGTGKVSGTNMSAQVNDAIWFAPGVGIVRRRQELIGDITATGPDKKPQKVRVGLGRLLRLKNFTAKK
jgi:hypothetical protein